MFIDVSLAEDAGLLQSGENRGGFEGDESVTESDRRDYLVQEKGERTRRIIRIRARGREQIMVRAGFQNNPLRGKSCTLFTTAKS